MAKLTKKDEEKIDASIRTLRKLLEVMEKLELERRRIARRKKRRKLKRIGV